MRWGQGTNPRDKFQLSFEDRGLQKRGLVLSTVRKAGSESPLLIEQWTNDTLEELKKKTPLSSKMQLEIYLSRQISFTC